MDAALGAEEMVENLTAKCLDWEERHAAVAEEKDDLEKLHDLNEELQARLPMNESPRPSMVIGVLHAVCL